MPAQETPMHLNPDAAVRTFFKDPEWRMKVAIGATINAVSVLVLFFTPMLFPVVVCMWAISCGYLLKVIRAGAGGGKLPEWRDWLELLISGLTWFAALTAFFFLWLSIPTVSFIWAAAAGATYAPNDQFLTWACATFTLTFCLGLFVHLIVTFLQANLAEEERMPAAFALFKITQRIRSHGDVLVRAWLLSIGLISVSILVPVCTIFGAFMLPTTLFIASTISATMIGQAWAASSHPLPPKTS
jgi:hypothetical protein